MHVAELAAERDGDVEVADLVPRTVAALAGDLDDAVLGLAVLVLGQDVLAHGVFLRVLGNTESGRSDPVRPASSARP
ncbi:hypothetical protein GCM10020254_42430 [Streptomyces goshikiensis]